MHGNKHIYVHTIQACDNTYTIVSQLFQALSNNNKDTPPASIDLPQSWVPWCKRSITVSVRAKTT